MCAKSESRNITSVIKRHLDTGMSLESGLKTGAVPGGSRIQRWRIAIAFRVASTGYRANCKKLVSSFGNCIRPEGI